MARGQAPLWVRDLLGMAGLLGAAVLAMASMVGRFAPEFTPIFGLFLSLLLVVLCLWLLRAQRLLARHTPDLNWDGFWGASLVVGSGCLLALISVVDPRDEAFNAPRWVATLAGVVFILFGVLAMRTVVYGAEAEDPGDPVSAFLLTLILTGFGAMCSFAAFGPGAREFEGGLSIGFFSFDFLQGEIPGRIAFGLAAVILDLFALFGWLSVLARLTKRRS